MTLKQAWQKRNTCFGNFVVKQKGFCIRSVPYTILIYCVCIEVNYFVLMKKKVTKRDYESFDKSFNFVTNHVP